MACNALINLLKACDENNLGGIYAIYAIDTDSVTATTISTSAHTITALGTIESFNTFEFKRNTGNWVSEQATDLLVGSNVYNSTLTLQFSRRQGTVSRALTVLAEGNRFLDIIVKGADGQFTYLDHMQLNGGSESSGTNKAEGSKYDVTFLGEMVQRPYFVDPSIIAALIA
jgi:hypothetical protein